MPVVFVLGLRRTSRALLLLLPLVVVTAAAATDPDDPFSLVNTRSPMPTVPLVDAVDAVKDNEATELARSVPDAEVSARLREARPLVLPPRACPLFTMS